MWWSQSKEIYWIACYGFIETTPTYTYIHLETLRWLGRIKNHDFFAWDLHVRSTSETNQPTNQIKPNQTKPNQTNKQRNKHGWMDPAEVTNKRLGSSHQWWFIHIRNQKDSLACGGWMNALQFSPIPQTLFCSSFTTIHIPTLK
jgi:hypothetical protein